jgi:hypothetical protein
MLLNLLFIEKNSIFLGVIKKGIYTYFFYKNTFVKKYLKIKAIVYKEQKKTHANFY